MKYAEEYNEKSAVKNNLNIQLNMRKIQVV